MSGWKPGFSFMLLCAFAGATQAAPLNVLGFDDMSCQAWARSKDDTDQRALYLAWMRGVLTGHNYARPGQQVATVSSATVEVHINRYCAEHAKGRFDDAIFRMSDQFSGRNVPITK